MLGEVFEDMPEEMPGRMFEEMFRELFKEACAAMQFDTRGYKPYSLRRGGATHDFRNHGVLSRTQLRGR